MTEVVAHVDPFRPQFPVHRQLTTNLHYLGSFRQPNLMHNFHLFINNIFVTLLSSTCFEH